MKDQIRVDRHSGHLAKVLGAALNLDTDRHDWLATDAGRASHARRPERSTLWRVLDVEAHALRDLGNAVGPPAMPGPAPARTPATIWASLTEDTPRTVAALLHDPAPTTTPTPQPHPPIPNSAAQRYIQDPDL
jgi:hypothetical protein